MKSLVWPRFSSVLVLVLVWVGSTSAAPSSDHETHEVDPRTDVLLSCEAPEGTDLENLALEWTRSDLDQEYYVFLFRDGRPFPVYQHRRFTGRVELTDPSPGSRNMSIRLLQVNPQDSGRYECHVFSQSHARKRAVFGTRPIRTIDLTVRELVRASPGDDVLLSVAKPDFPVTSLMWKREDDPEHFVFLSGMGHPHHQHPRYSGRTELSQDRDLSVILRQVRPSDSGVYHCYIIQSQQRVKRDLSQSEPYAVIDLRVLSSGALRPEAGAVFLVSLLVSMTLQTLQ